MITTIKSPVGILSVEEIDGVVTHLDWVDEEQCNSSLNSVNILSDYFNKTSQEFDVKVNPCGTNFQKKVWKALMDIPYGETITYGELAKKVGSHPRAVGGAVGANPIPIIIPCHRVMGANGKLTGYSGRGGIETKKYLLDLEKSEKK